MSDEWYSPGHQIIPLGIVPRPREPAYVLGKNGREVTCEQRYLPNELGVEVLSLYNGELGYTRRFPTRAGALLEAEHHRERLQREGWTEQPTEASAAP